MISNLTNIFQMGWNHQLVLNALFTQFTQITREVLIPENSSESLQV